MTRPLPSLTSLESIRSLLTISITSGVSITIKYTQASVDPINDNDKIIYSCVYNLPRKSVGEASPPDPPSTLKKVRKNEKLRLEDGDFARGSGRATNKYFNL